jgi:hypothetical protein
MGACSCRKSGAKRFQLTGGQPTIGKALLPTNSISTACLYPSTPWLPPRLTVGLRKTEPGASAEASKRYPSTLIEVGCAQHAMYKKVHDDAYSGANQPVYGKPKTMRPCTYLPLYSDRVCKTALHLNTRARRRPLRVMLGPHHLLYKTLGSRTPHTPTHIIRASMGFRARRFTLSTRYTVC